MTSHPRLAALISAAALLAAGITAPAAAAPSSPDGLTLIATKRSLLAEHRWYQQTYQGIAVLGGYYATHTDTRTGVVLTQDGRLAVGVSPAMNAAIGAARAQAAAASLGTGTVTRSHLVVLPGAAGRLA